MRFLTDEADHELCEPVPGSPCFLSTEIYPLAEEPDIISTLNPRQSNLVWAARVYLPLPTTTYVSST